MPLNVLAVPNLPPGDHTDVNGLVLRVRPSGARSWSVRYSLAGRVLRFTIGKVKIKPTDKGLTLKQARDRTLEILADVVAGRDPQAEKVAARRAPRERGLTVKALGADVLKRLDLSPKTRVDYERWFKVDIVSEFGTRVATTVTRAEIRAWSERKAKTAPYSANRAFGLMRRIYSVGVQRDLIPASPFVYLPAPAKETSSDRVLSSAELWALLRALEQMPGTGSDVVRLLLLTGVRRAMVLGARREEFEGLDEMAPQWVVPGERCKSGREHLVPLSRQAVAIVKARLDGDGDGEYLFPAGNARNGRRAKSKTKAWRSSYVAFLRKRMDRILIAAGQKPAEPWEIRNLRQTARTRMRERLGVPKDVAELILAHLKPGIEGVYDRSELLAERRVALQAWADDCEKLPAPGKNVAQFKKEANR